MPNFARYLGNKLIATYLKQSFSDSASAACTISMKPNPQCAGTNPKPRRRRYGGKTAVLVVPRPFSLFHGLRAEVSNGLWVKNTQLEH
jgi:hypothetical protein